MADFPFHLSRNYQMRLLRRRSCLFCSGQKDHETRSGLTPLPDTILRRFHADGAMMTVDDLRYDRKSKSNATFFRGYKGIENLLAQFRRNPGSGIRNANLDPLRTATVSRVTD